MKQFDTWLEKRWRWAYWGLVLLAVGLYGLLSLDGQVWADEAYTFALIRHSWGQIWRITAADVHPPLYYFLLKLLAAPFGYSLPVCRFLSAVPCLLVLAVGGWQLERLQGKPLAFRFMALYLLFPYAMSGAAEVRMYGLAQLFVALCALYAYRAWQENRGKDWALFALSGTCAAYTHYFALVAAGLIYGFLLLCILLRKRKLWKPWALASLATVVLFLPWLGSFISQLAYKVSNAYWIEPIIWSTVVDYVLTLFSAGGLGAYPLFAGLSYLLALLLVCADRRNRWLGLLALAVPVGTVAVGLAASILVRPVFVIRYILPCVPLLVFFFAYALGRVRSEMLLSALLTVAVMGGVSNGLVEVANVLSPEAGRIDGTYTAALPEHDAYLVLGGNTLHASQELSYWDSALPIYTIDALGADNPYPNRVSYDTFRPGDYDTLILFLDQEAPIPQELAEIYTAEALPDVTVSGTVIAVWYLARQ